MSGPSLTTQRHTIAAGASLRVSRACEFVTCLEASGPFLIAFNEGPTSSFESGLTYRAPDEGIATVRIENTSAAPITVTMAYGRGDLVDNRAAFSGTIETRAAVPETWQSYVPQPCPDGVSTGVLPALAGREFATVVNMGAGTVYVQSQAQSAGWGIPLEPKQSLTLRTSAAIRVRNDTGATVDIARAETGFAP